MMTIPLRTTIDKDDANGLNKMIMPQIKSTIPSSSNHTQFDTPFFIVIAMLMMLTLDSITHIPSAMPNIVGNIPGIAISIIPIMIDNMPETIPKNGI